MGVWVIRRPFLDKLQVYSFYGHLSLSIVVRGLFIDLRELCPIYRNILSVVMSVNLNFIISLLFIFYCYIMSIKLTIQL